MGSTIKSIRRGAEGEPPQIETVKQAEDWFVSESNENPN